jgi:hypothetical protein
MLTELSRPVWDLIAQRSSKRSNVSLQFTSGIYYGSGSGDRRRNFGAIE